MNDYGPLYTYHGAVGYFFSDGTKYGIFVITKASPDRDFIGWEIDISCYSQIPDKFHLFHGWGVHQDDLTLLPSPLAEIYE